MKHFEPLMTYLSPFLTERRELGLLGQHPEELLLDLLRAAEDDGRAGQAVGAEAGLDPRATPGQLLLDQAAVHVGRARTAVLLRDVGVHEPHFPGLLDDVLRPGAVLVVLPGLGTDLLLGEVVRHLAQRLLLVGQREVDHVLARLLGFSRGAPWRYAHQIDWSVNPMYNRVPRL
jgi:hypothetical protein